MAPRACVERRRQREARLPTDTWWHTIVSPTGKEKTGYPTQKPLGIINRIIRVHSSPGDRVLDFFAGSGTTGESAYRNDRSCVLVDSNDQAMKVMEDRLAFASPAWHGWKPRKKSLFSST
jgi:DNA modification methylase